MPLFMDACYIFEHADVTTVKPVCFLIYIPLIHELNNLGIISRGQTNEEMR